MKQLPEKIALNKAVHGRRLYTGSMGSTGIQQMSRLIDMLADTNGQVEFSIQLDKAVKLLGKAQVKVTADLPLICTISARRFMFHVEIDSTLGFIDDLAYEEFIQPNMEASWIEGGFIKPLEIIEDELVLAVPDAPFDENYAIDNLTEATIADAEQKPNPFNILNKFNIEKT